MTRLALAGLLLFAVADAADAGPSRRSGGLAQRSVRAPRMVAICHVVEGAPGAILIVVPERAVPAHLAHGDFEPTALGCEQQEPPPPVTCGGFAGFPCEGCAQCFDAPDDCDPNCGGADCGGFCAHVLSVPCDADADCSPGNTCLDDPRDECSPDCGDAGCAKVCVSLTDDNCGTILGLSCPEGTCCFDDPGDTCDEPCGADCQGSCGTFQPVPCAGFLGLDCPPDSTCVDDPADDCHPGCGGADCPGVCVVPIPAP